MLRPNDQDLQIGNMKNYLRSVSWTDQLPNKPNPSYSIAQPSPKARLCLPPLQPLSIARQSVEEWPEASTDDLGIWPQAATSSGGIGSLRIEVPNKEFQSNKDKLAFYEKECSRIKDHVYLGSEMVAKNREVLRQNGITHVLNCVGFICPEYFKGDLVYKTLWLQDSPLEDITSVMYDVFDYFEEVRERNGRVLVHCSRGVSRSTSLVIAYLMWKEAQSFDESFQFVKAARGVTNPNMGFACQLLQCQKRVHAVPASPNSVLRMYRMAPHSPYDPLHLVPKMLTHPGEHVLDSRGAFVVHVPSAIYVWIGKYCSSVMANDAWTAAQQVVKYESAPSPVLTIKEDGEPSEFWVALSMGEVVHDDFEMVELIERLPMNGGKASQTCMTKSCDRNRKINAYDVDFEIFHRALAGGVVPPFTLPGSAYETCLPIRENEWGGLRKEVANNHVMEDLLSSSIENRQVTESYHETEQVLDSQYVTEEPVSPTAYLLQSFPGGSISGYIVPETGDICESLEHYVGHRDHPCPSPSPCCSPESCSPCLNISSSFTCKSPSLSPSTSDSCSSFMFSPSSSNWSDLSLLSSQTSPSALDYSDHLCSKNPASVDPVLLFGKVNSESCLEAFSAMNSWKSSNLCSSGKGTSLSRAERRGSNPPTLMLQPSVERARVLRTLPRSLFFSLPELSDETLIEVGGEELKHEIADTKMC